MCDPCVPAPMGSNQFQLMTPRKCFVPTTKQNKVPELIVRLLFLLQQKKMFCLLHAIFIITYIASVWHWRVRQEKQTEHFVSCELMVLPTGQHILFVC